MSTDFKRVEALFYRAMEKTEPAERAEFLNRECAGDSGLRRLVDHLLIANGKLKALAPQSEGEATIPKDCNQGILNTWSLPVDEVGTIIAGKYKLLQVIGEGGMGVVYMAEQIHPVKRVVALKVIRFGMDSNHLIARFEVERQALALMNHPNIAHVLDAGTVETNQLNETGSGGTGRPFLVMDLIKGIPLTRYCDERHLNVQDRLRIFLDVCSAMQHAHQKGIIHRDLKPTNILVESHDGNAVAKIIDFGLAKAMHALPLTEKSLFTHFGTVIGTPSYMAPEQAEFNARDVDTRTDIYALGAILYELLTGTTPFEKERFNNNSWDEIQRVIKEEDPPTPSKRMTDSKLIEAVATLRNSEPLKLTKMIRGDLDWVVMKALAKERDRRYETVSSFALDIERFLENRPVSAGPPTIVYKIRNFMRRYRNGVLAAGIVLLALIGGIIGTTWGMLRARDAENKAIIAAKMEREAKEQESLRAAGERQANLKSQKLLQQVEKSNEILSSIFRDLDPQSEEKKGKPLRLLLGERLDQATRELEGDAVGTPLAVAKMQVLLGRSHAGLGYHDKAILLLTQARATYTSLLGPDHVETLSSSNQLAAHHLANGNAELAQPLFDETLKICKAKLGPDHPETLNAMSGLGMAYQSKGLLNLTLPLFEETLRLRKYKLGLDHDATLKSMNNLAAAQFENGKIDLAIPLYEETLNIRKNKLGLDHADTLLSMNNLAFAYKAKAKYDLALPLFLDSLSRMKKSLGPDHPSTLNCMNNLATAYIENNQLDLAIPQLQEALKRLKAKLPLDHPETLAAMNNLAEAYRKNKNLDQALSLHLETLQLRKSKYGENHPETLTTVNNLALTYAAQNKIALALPLFEETLNITKAIRGQDHPETLISMNNLAMAYRQVKKYDLAIPLLQQSLKVRRATTEADHPNTINSIYNLAQTYEDAGQLEKAVPLYSEALALRKVRDGTDSIKTLNLMHKLAISYFSANQPEKGEAIYKEYVEIKKQSIKKNDTGTANILAIMAQDFLKFQRYSSAEPLLREAKVLRDKLAPEFWTTFETHSLLGAALLGQGKFAEAEPLLLSGYEGMKNRLSAIPKASRGRFVNSIERLVQLYTVWNKPAKVDEWRKLLAEEKNK